MASVVSKCNPFAPYKDAPAIWYHWRSPADATAVSFSTCHPGTTFGTDMMLLTGPAPSCPRCQSISHASCPSGSGSVITTQVTGDTDYYLLITGVGPMSAGPFVLTMAASSGDCADGTELTIPSALEGLRFLVGVAGMGIAASALA